MKKIKRVIHLQSEVSLQLLQGAAC